MKWWIYDWISQHWFNVNFVDQQCCSFCSSTFKQCIMVHGMLKWAIKHANADEWRSKKTMDFILAITPQQCWLLLIKECLNLLNPVSSAFSSSQQEYIYNTCQKSWNTCLRFPLSSFGLGITVVSVPQNMGGSTLEKGRGPFEWEQKCEEWICNFRENSRDAVSVSLICEEYCSYWPCTVFRQNLLAYWIHPQRDEEEEL